MFITINNKLLYIASLFSALCRCSVATSDPTAQLTHLADALSHLYPPTTGAKTPVPPPPKLDSGLKTAIHDRTPLKHVESEDRKKEKVAGPTAQGSDLLKAVREGAKLKHVAPPVEKKPAPEPTPATETGRSVSEAITKSMAGYTPPTTPSSSDDEWET